MNAAQNIRPIHLNTHSYPGISQGEASRRGREILEARIAKGRASAVRLVEHVQTHVPEDTVVAARAVEFVVGDRGVETVWRDGRTGEEVQRPLHRHALGQVSAKAGVPLTFLAELSTSTDSWRRSLAADILNKHFHERSANAEEDVSAKRFLFRAVNNELRGVLSDKYRRIDSRPTIEAFAEECAALGAQPYEGIVSDVRVSLRALLPMVFEPVPGEILAFGVEWGNSDFGAAKHWMRTFILRLACLNGATTEDVMAQVHTGTRLSDNFEFSKATLEADTKAQVLGLRDVVRGALGPKNVGSVLDGIKAAHEQERDWKSVSRGMNERLTKAEQKLAKDAFDSEDVINLPAGKSTWRLSNALSWIANGEAVDADRKIELQRMAGEVLTGKRDKVASAE